MRHRACLPTIKGERATDVGRQLAGPHGIEVHIQAG